MKLRTPVNGRRDNALTRLKAQLKLGTKNTKKGIEQLTEPDIKRIEKEIGILKNRVIAA